MEIGNSQSHGRVQGWEGLGNPSCAFRETSVCRKGRREEYRMEKSC